MDFKIEQEKTVVFFEVIDELDQLLTERIVDLHKVKGGIQARHAYCYYRNLLWEARSIMDKNLKEIKD